MNLTPRLNYVLLEALNPEEEKTKAGLLIPAGVEMNAFKLPMAVIVKTGPEVSPTLHAKTKVLYSSHAGWKHTHLGKLYILLPDREILATVE